MMQGSQTPSAEKPAGSEKPTSAVARAAATGSVLSRGAGAQPEPKAKAKAKAKATAVPTTTTVTTARVAAVPPTTRSSAPGSGPSLAAPSGVIGIVTGKPAPASTGGASMQNNAAGSKVGPARGYAAAAAPHIPAAPGGDGVPKQGPAAVAVGRTVASGKPPIMFGNGKPRAPISKKYQIVFVTSEVAPFSKTGGLGEAMDGLPTALAGLGHRVMVIAPRYDQYKEGWDTNFWSTVTLGGKQESVHFFHCFKQKVDYVFVDHPTFLERVNGLTGSKLYGPEWGKDFPDNQSRFAYFCKAALVAITSLPMGGAIYGDNCTVLCNDWHSALVPMFIHTERANDSSKWAPTKTAFLCHNAVFQGRFEREEGLAQVWGVPEHYVEKITFEMPVKAGKFNEKVNCINTMAAGLLYADRALTVSPSYAVEVSKDAKFGVELEGLFAKANITGILNGVKEGVSPSDKNFVTKTMMTCGTFTAATADAAKAELKATYRAENNLPAVNAPLMCFIGRLDLQKGYDLLLESLTEVLETEEMQVIIVGSGTASLVAQTKAAEKKFPGKFFYAGWMGPERYALLAACDYTLLPSRWEPCGLVQMEAMRMGTCPIIAPTGGLKDTVVDGLNGIWTDADMIMESDLCTKSVSSISKALKRAAKIYTDEPAKMVEMKKAAMAAAAEFTWSNAALQYEAIFEEMGAKDTLCGADASVTLETDKQVC
eukprot:TRINITY_DN1202_c2_g1_i1.p1 TRINITY_DN1202_c2_g1~~TRINITY_DN1202_c2_g1_i1.p1  ORF type:complete len:710 (+),score=160.50 TRINITY_DN1202_c2_g1_i1:89-2218(+)